MNESYHSSRTTQKPKKVPLVKSIVARAKNRTPWTVQACVEACACDRTPDTTRTGSLPWCPNIVLTVKNLAVKGTANVMLTFLCSEFGKNPYYCHSHTHYCSVNGHQSKESLLI